jgi:hypothetical protein
MADGAGGLIWWTKMSTENVIYVSQRPLPPAVHAKVCFSEAYLSGRAFPRRRPGVRKACKAQGGK